MKQRKLALRRLAFHARRPTAGLSLLTQPARLLREKYNMRAKIFFISLFLIIALIAAACKTNPSSAGDKVIKSTKSGDMTITIASATGDLKVGDNDLMLSFTDASGNLVDVGAASLAFHMPAMGAMGEMNNKAQLTTTDTPGKYRAQIKVEMTGTWEARVTYQGSHGNGDTTISVQAK